MNPSECPPEDALGRYAAGALSEAEAHTIDSHLGRCTACLNRLDSLASQPDPLVAALRLPTGSTKENPELAKAVAAVLAEDTLSLRPRAKDAIVGTVVSGYVVLEQIGYGGMGRVYRARHPRLDQDVALKVLRPGLDSTCFLARFEAERQTLALMDHPYIARISDGGVTDQGLPFLVMELVRGVSVTRYCEERQLDLRQRLRLCIQTCEAVQHAHQKGVIHRDIKPSNILVVEYDGRPTPKVIDFGVAKAIEQRAVRETEVGMLVGTPEYMSPEQADPSCLDIDTRCDVYALGVLLYELLTGDTPFGRQRIHESPILEVLRMICEGDPPPPSHRRETAVPTRSGDGTARGLLQARLSNSQWQELDEIVRKCLVKDRARRYETAAALAEDVRRFLNDEPILAGLPSKTYRLRKFVKRNRSAVVAASLIVLALIGGIVGTSLGLVRARDERSRAETERDEKTAALARLEQEQHRTRAALVAQTQAGKQALSALRNLTDDMVERQLARQVTLTDEDRKFLKKIIAEYQAFANLRGDGEESRAIRAEGYFRVGLLRYQLGELADAFASYERSRELFGQLTADFPNVTEHRLSLAGIHNNLGNLLKDQGKSTDAKAEFVLALTLGKQLVDQWPLVPQFRRRLAESHLNLGNWFATVGNNAAAAAEYRLALTLSEQLIADAPAEAANQTAKAMNHHNLGIVLRRLAKRPEAEAEYHEALRLWKQLATDFPSVPYYRSRLASHHANLGSFLDDVGDDSGALADYQSALVLQKQLAADFPTVPNYRSELANTHNNLGTLLQKQKKFADAKVEYRYALDLQKRLAVDFPTVLDYVINLGGGYCNFGNLLRSLGEPDKALDWYHRAVETLAPVVAREPRLATARRFLVNSHYARARAFMEVNQFDEAIKDWDRVRELDDGKDPTTVRLRRAECLARVNPGRAVAEAEEVIQRDTPSTAMIYTAAAICSLSAAHTTDHVEREKHAARAVALLELARGKGHFKNKAFVAYLKKDTDFDPLRMRADFRRLVAELEPSRP